jgi:catechol 2,3-dioxygenase-like lactoylglutathione lyase family enzyme
MRQRAESRWAWPAGLHGGVKPRRSQSNTEAIFMTTIATAVKFHVGLNVADLGRSVRFYRTLLGTEPAKHYDDYAKFELDEPALVLALYPNPQQTGGALNHMGLRLPDAAALVETQRRLEMDGIATQREEGVECCYALQTKFWVTDPDGNLCEVYTVHADIDHHGFGGPPETAPAPPKPAAVAWQHFLMQPVPDRIPHDDGSVDEVLLEGTLNVAWPESTWTGLLAEIRRVLRPGGKIVLHGLVSDRPFPGKPALPGMAALVQHIPVETEPGARLRRAGFVGQYFEKLGDIHCFQVGDTELRELRLCAWQPGTAPETRHVVYKGPFASLRDDNGTVFLRGVCVSVARDQWELLRNGPTAGQFVFLDAPAAAGF